MAYLGRGVDKISNVETLDNITFNGASSYTLQKGGVNFVPISAAAILISIDGIVQSGNFTVSTSTIDFGTAIAGTSTCNFIIHLGVGLVTTPSDGSVTSAKISFPLTTFSSTGIDDNADATAITIDSSEQVGIGTTSPSAQLHVTGSDTTDQVIFENTDTGSGSAPDLVFYRNSSSPADNDILGRMDFRGKNDAGQDVDYFLGYATVTDVSDGTEDAKFQLEAKKAGSNANLLTLSEAEAVFNEDSNDVDFRVESNNNANTLFVDGANDAVIFGDGSNTSPATSSTATHAVIPSSGRMQISASSHACLTTNRVNSEGITIELRQAGGVRGSISVAGASAAFNTSSDYRLKENVSYDFDATTRLKQLKPARFNWISDETNTAVDGFIAHEVTPVVPQATSGEKDAVDEDGNIEPQQIDQSKLVPLLVKTIQELEARITTLENA